MQLMKRMITSAFLAWVLNLRAAKSAECCCSLAGTSARGCQAGAGSGHTMSHLWLAEGAAQQGEQSPWPEPHPPGESRCVRKGGRGGAHIENALLSPVFKIFICPIESWKYWCTLIQTSGWNDDRLLKSVRRIKIHQFQRCTVTVHPLLRSNPWC